VNEVMAGTVRDAVHQRLDYIDRLATTGDTRSLAMLASSEIVRLTGAWRVVLNKHAPDEHNRCRACSGWRRPARYPCAVWTTALSHLLADDPQAPPRPRHSHRRRKERDR
jgi:hypothetical protein